MLNISMFVWLKICKFSFFDESLFIVVTIVCGGFMFGPCFIEQYFCRHLAKE